MENQGKSNLFLLMSAPAWLSINTTTGALFVPFTTIDILFLVAIPADFNRDLCSRIPLWTSGQRRVINRKIKSHPRALVWFGDSFLEKLELWGVMRMGDAGGGTVLHLPSRTSFARRIIQHQPRHQGRSMPVNTYASPTGLIAVLVNLP